MFNRQVWLPLKLKWYWWLVMAVGYLLSPFSWWNDLFINLPLAYLGAVVLSLVSRKLFAPAMILGYWLTNLLGIFLMHQAGWRIATAATDSGKDAIFLNRRRSTLINILTTLGYSLIVIVLISAGVIKPPAFISRIAR